MKKLIVIQITITAFIFAQTDGEVVKNVTAAQRTDGSKLVDISYDLENDYNSYSVYVTVDESAGNHNFILQTCTGDVWVLNKDWVLPSLCSR